MADLCTFDSTLTTFDSTVRTFDQTTCQQVTPPQQIVFVGDGAISWQEYVKQEFRRRHLIDELEEEEEKLEKVEKRIVQARKKLKSEPTEGILANLFKLEIRKEELVNKIQALKVEMIPLQAFFDAEIDDDDEEVLLMS